MNFVFYTDRWIKPGFAGCANGPLIFIQPQYRDDAGLLAHEREHVKQFWRLPVLHSLRYLLSDAYRLKCEVAAYRVQAACYPDDKRPYFAKMIAEKYGLGISPEAALALLLE